MPRKKADIHYIYKTTNVVTGRYYIGMHSTSKLDDGYMGSGKKLRYSIRKYGVDNHVKEVLEYLPTRELLAEREREIVTSELIQEDLCMNLKEGGSGGFTFEIHQQGGFATTEKYKDMLSEWGKKGGKRAIELHGKPLNFKSDWNGKTHTEETKRLLSEKRKGTGVGETNSQYNTCWITKDGVNKKIKKEDLESWVNEGWVKGRIRNTGF